MILYPAIDIRGGRCVRLVEGDFDRETAFDADPADAALVGRMPARAGSMSSISSGSVAGEPVNLDAIARIRDAVDIPIQLGGGIRTEAHIAAALDRGVNRVILGTAALAAPRLVESAAKRWGDQIASGSTLATASSPPAVGSNKPMSMRVELRAGHLAGSACGISSSPTFAAMAR